MPRETHHEHLRLYARLPGCLRFSVWCSATRLLHRSSRVGPQQSALWQMASAIIVTVAQTPDGSPPGTIAAANTEFVAAFLVQDARAIAHYYTPQGRLLLSHVELIRGRSAIQAFWQGVLDMGIYCAERATVDLQSVATLGNEIGTYVFRRRDGHLADQGTYVALWQWQAGRWQIRYEVWRSGWLVARNGDVVGGRSEIG